MSNLEIEEARDLSEELIRLRERVAILERELLAARPLADWNLFEKSPLPVWTTVDDRIVFANREMEKMLGAPSREKLVGRSVFDFIIPEHHEMVRERSRVEIDEDRVAPITEGQLITFDGKRIDVQVTSISFRHGSGWARHVSFIDISARKRADARQAETLQRFQELAENLREVFYIIDPVARRTLYVSPGYEAVWQRSCQSLYENFRSWMDSVHPDDRGRMERAILSPEGLKEEYRILRGDGEVRSIRARTFPVRDANGQPVRIVGFCEDVTEWKRLEQQLVQSQKMDAVGRLAGGIAHDFNNVLTVINGYSAMLAERIDLPEDVHSDLQSIRRAGQRAAALTAQLLTFSRTQSMQPRNVDLNEVVRVVEPILRRLIREDVELITALLPEQVCVRADPSQLEQVILNLVINARDAIEEVGTITLETGIEKDAAGVPRAVLAVSDTGCGMSQQTQDRIFEPFFSTKESGKGTGLGLATVYGVVKQTGGTIWVYSEQGEGSTFKIYLPLTQSAENGGPEPAERISSRGSGTILFVEDEESVRKMSVTSLRTRGYRVLEAANGEDAMALVGDNPSAIDVLVTDVIMPRMGGTELAQRLLGLNPKLRVLYISGYTENAVIHTGRVQPGVQYLAKPFTPDALARKVAEVIAPRTMTA